MPDFREIADFEFTTEFASENVRRLVRNLLTREPSQRLRSLAMLQRHSFYHHFDFDGLKSLQVNTTTIVPLESNFYLMSDQVNRQDNFKSKDWFFATIYSYQNDDLNLLISM